MSHRFFKTVTLSLLLAPVCVAKEKIIPFNDRPEMSDVVLSRTEALAGFIRLYRDKNGHLPTSLRQLIPAIASEDDLKIPIGDGFWTTFAIIPPLADPNEPGQSMIAFTLSSFGNTKLVILDNLKIQAVGDAVFQNWMLGVSEDNGGRN